MKAPEKSFMWNRSLKLEENSIEEISSYQISRWKTKKKFQAGIMSRNIIGSIKISECEQRTDHSEKVENKIKEVIVFELSAITVLKKRDVGVVLWN